MSRTLMPWVMWFLPLSFFGFQFILRLFPGLVMPEIMDKYQIDATSYGFFASLYYYGYAGFQLPMAYWLEKYGAKKTVALSILVCGAAVFLFLYSNHWSLVLLSRFLMGAGSAVGFLGTSKVIAEWFKHNQYTKMVGLSFTFGLLGAVYGGRPVSTLLSSYGWQEITYWLAMGGMLLTAIVWIG